MTALSEKSLDLQYYIWDADTTDRILSLLLVEAADRGVRVRSHVMLCWLALLLMRITELETGMVWPRVRTELERLDSGKFLHIDGHIIQHT